MYFSCVYQKKVLLLQALFNRALCARKKFDLVAKDREYLSLITKSGAKVLQKNEKYK